MECPNCKEKVEFVVEPPDDRRMTANIDCVHEDPKMRPGITPNMVRLNDQLISKSYRKELLRGTAKVCREFNVIPTKE
jgi:hypothetical protein